MNFLNSCFSNRLFNTYSLLTAAIVGLSMPNVSHAAVVINDSFTDGNRTNQSLPDSAEWYSRAGTSTASVSGNSLTFDPLSVPNNGVVGYFTNSGTIDLATGQSISLSFDLTVNQQWNLSSLGNRLRFGLMDSKGSRVTADNSGFNDSIFNGYEGYWGTITPSGINDHQGDPDATSIGKRDKMKDSLPTTSAMTRLGTFDHSRIMQDTTYQFTLEVMKTDDNTNTITMTVDGPDWTKSFVQMDTSDTFISFDTAVISLHDLRHEEHLGLPVSATIGNIRVSTVPEPTALAIWSLVSMALLGLAMFSRRQRRQLPQA